MTSLFNFFSWNLKKKSKLQPKLYNEISKTLLQRISWRQCVVLLWLKPCMTVFSNTPPQKTPLDRARLHSTFIRAHKISPCQSVAFLLLLINMHKHRINDTPSTDQLYCYRQWRSSCPGLSAKLEAKELILPRNNNFVEVA